jgi:hypothetical protein
MPNELETLPRMIARATALLVRRRVLPRLWRRAKKQASSTMLPGRLGFAKLKSAHAEVCATARKMMADALTIEARAQVSRRRI